MQNDKNIHSGHRDRMRARFLKKGLDDFNDHEILELLLYYCIPRRNTNPIAHELIHTFKFISAVFDAPLKALTDFGLSENSAVLIKLIPQLVRVYLDDKQERSQNRVNIERVGNLMKDKFIGRKVETVILLLLDVGYNILFCGVVGEGSVSSCDVYIKKLVEIAASYNASYAVVGHNHPSGIIAPSDSDVYCTEVIANALSTVGVRLLDHVIVSDNDFVSFRQSNLCGDLFKV